LEGYGLRRAIHIIALDSSGIKSDKKSLTKRIRKRITTRISQKMLTDKNPSNSLLIRRVEVLSTNIVRHQIQPTDIILLDPQGGY
jgi:hypothetical protein